MNENLNTATEQRLGQRGLAFFGKITASISHELSNVIAIIDQNNGLLEDLLAGAKEGAPLDIDRLQRVAESIDQQTERGVEILQRMNTFAHSVDEPFTLVDLNRLAGTITGLCQRFAQIKQVKLDVRYAAEDLRIITDPFKLSEALFICMDRAFCCADTGVVVRFSVLDASRRNGVRFVIEGKGAGVVDKDERLEYLTMLMNRLGGHVQVEAHGEHGHCELFLPTTPPNA